MTKNPPRDGVAEVRGQIDRLETALLEAAWNESPDEADQLAATVAQLVGLYEIQETIDIANDMAWMKDGPRCKEINEALNILWKRWLALAQHADSVASRLPRGGDEVGELAALRKLAVEVKAFLNPSYVISGKMLEFCEEAMAEYARGETLEGLVD